MLFVFVLLVGLFSSNAFALGTQGQVMISSSAEYKLGERIGFVNNGNLLGDTSGYLVVFGYQGLRISLDKQNDLFLLAGERVDSKVLSAMLSIQYSSTSEFISTFVEADVWFPVVGNGDPQFYSWAQVTTPAFGGNIGLANENIVRLTGQADEVAVGPFWDTVKYSLWGGYDFVGQNIFLRTIFKI